MIILLKIGVIRILIQQIKRENGAMYLSVIECMFVRDRVYVCLWQSLHTETGSTFLPRVPPPLWPEIVHQIFGPCISTQSQTRDFFHEFPNLWIRPEFKLWVFHVNSKSISDIDITRFFQLIKKISILIVYG